MNKSLYEGPGFVKARFLSVKRWEPNFVPEVAMLTHIAIWIRLSQLTREIYDSAILEKIRKRLGFLLKIVTCTSPHRNPN